MRPRRVGPWIRVDGHPGRTRTHRCQHRRPRPSPSPIATYQDGTNGAQRVAWTQGVRYTPSKTAAGTQAQQRATTRNTYNSGRPADAPTSDLATSAVTGGLPLEADPGTAALDAIRLPTATTGGATVPELGTARAF